MDINVNPTNISNGSQADNTPDFILFAQHGWADSSQAIATLAQAVASPRTLVVAPNLGYFKTWLRIAPLIAQVERIALETIARYPRVPIKIMGHSMGGLIWLEVLNLHPEWWPHIHSLVLIASPVGGADLARILDPLAIGVGIARDLGINRRHLAESVAKIIPTLVIAGDLDNGSDGTITIETTKFSHAQFMSLPNLAHAALKNHPSLVEIIRNFWENPIIVPPTELDNSTVLIQHLRLLPGMTDGHWRDFRRAKAYLTFKDGLTIRTWTHPLRIEHVFVGNKEEQCLYAGYVGWRHRTNLRKALDEIKNTWRVT